MQGGEEQLEQSAETACTGTSYEASSSQVSQVSVIQAGSKCLVEKCGSLLGLQVRCCPWGGREDGRGAL